MEIKTNGVGHNGLNIRPIVALDYKIGITPKGRIMYLGDQPIVRPNFEIWAIRHGKTLGNELKILQGAANIPVVNQLNGKGWNDAFASANFLYNKLSSRIDQKAALNVITSEMIRTKESAQPFINIVKQMCGITLPVLEEKSLNEISFGVLANKPFEIPSEETRIKLISLGLSTDAIKEEHDNTRMKWMNGDAEVCFEDGESFIDCLIRAKGFIDMNNQLHSGSILAMFGHGTIISALRVILKSDVLRFIGTDPITGEENVILWRSNGFELKNGEAMLLTEPLK